MLFAKYLALCGALLGFPSAVNAQDLWVSDSLTTYVRSGPSDGYRIVGALSSGEKVTKIREQNEYSEILLANGKKVWIAKQDLQPQPVAAEQVPLLTAKVDELTTTLGQQDQNWQSRIQGLEETLTTRKALIDELSGQNQGLLKQLAHEQAALRETQAKLGQEQQQLLMQYLVYGGGIAGVGLVAGLLLPALTRNRTGKRQSEWV